jgi:hypothetical protein
MPAANCIRRQDRTATSGQPACATPMIRSARPTCPPPMTNSVLHHTSRASIIPAATAETAGRSPHGTEGPRRRPKWPGHQGGEADRRPKRVRQRAPGLLGVRRDQQAGETACHQDEAARCGGQPERQPGYDLAGPRRYERERHHPAVSSGHRRDAAAVRLVAARPGSARRCPCRCGMPRLWCHRLL